MLFSWSGKLNWLQICCGWQMTNGIQVLEHSAWMAHIIDWTHRQRRRLFILEINRRSCTEIKTSHRCRWREITRWLLSQFLISSCSYQSVSVAARLHKDLPSVDWLDEQFKNVNKGRFALMSDSFSSEWDSGLTIVWGKVMRFFTFEVISFIFRTGDFLSTCKLVSHGCPPSNKTNQIISNNNWFY